MANSLLSFGDGTNSSPSCSQQCRDTGTVSPKCTLSVDNDDSPASTRLHQELAEASESRKGLVTSTAVNSHVLITSESEEVPSSSSPQKEEASTSEEEDKTLSSAGDTTVSTPQEGTASSDQKKHNNDGTSETDSKVSLSVITATSISDNVKSSSCECQRCEGFQQTLVNTVEQQSEWLLTFEQFVQALQTEPELCQFFAEQNTIDLSGSSVDSVLNPYTRTIQATSLP